MGTHPWGWGQAGTWLGQGGQGLGQQLQPGGWCGVLCPRRLGSPVWLTGSGRAVNVLRAFFPLHLLWDFKIILLFLFKFFTSFFQSQRLHHRSAGGSSPSDLESVGPAGTYGSFLFFPCSRNLWGGAEPRDLWSRHCSTPCFSLRQRGPSKAGCEG